MKRLCTVLLVLVAFSSVQAQTTLTQWTFNGTLVPTTGTGSVQLIGGVTGVYKANTGSDQSTDPTAAPNDSTYETTFYPLPSTNDRTAGIQFAVSTVGFNTIQLTFDQRLSNKAANTWAVFYTADITAGSPVWVEVTAQLLTFTPAASGTGDRWYNGRTINFSAISAVSDNAKAGFKIVAAFDPANGANYLSARSSSTYAGEVDSGTVRFDMITITGVPVEVEENQAPTLSNLGMNGVLVPGLTITGNYTYIDAEADPEGTTTFKWYSATDANGAGATAIPGATGMTYVVAAGDVGKFIGFEVTPVAQTGTSPGVPMVAAYIGPVLDLGDPSVVKINEVYSRGDAEHEDDDLKADWVEFYNPGTKDVTLANLRICDSGACETFSSNNFAQLIVPAGGFLALEEDGPNSFTFGLSSLGEYVVLKKLDDTVIDSLAFPALEDTVSYGRFPNGSIVMDTLYPATRAASNNTSQQAHPPVEVTGINDELSSTSVYPVPSSGDILIESSQIMNTIVLVNQLGQTVGGATPMSKSVRIPGATLNRGLYLMKINYGSGKWEMRRVIKE